MNPVPRPVTPENSVVPVVEDIKMVRDLKKRMRRLFVTKDGDVLGR